MDRLPQHDETNDDDELPYLAEESDYRELNFDGDEDDEFDDGDFPVDDEYYDV